MPHPAPPPRSRRVDPDKYPFNLLPVLVYEPDTDGTPAPEAGADPNQARTRHGTVHVTRGEVDTTTLNRVNLDQLATYPGIAHVVFTNRIGQHELRRRGDLVPIGLDLTRVGWLHKLGQPDHRADTLTGYAHDIREHAHKLLDIADQYDAMAADGWELHNGPYDDTWHWPLRDTKPGPSYAPRPPA